MSRDLRSALWVGAWVTLFLLVFHRSDMIGSDEIGVYDQTVSLAERLDLAVPPHIHAYPGRDGQLYSHYAIGQSVLALPFYAVGSLVEELAPRRVRIILSGPGSAMGDRVYRSPHVFAVQLLPVLLTGLIAALFYLFQRQQGVSPAFSAAAAVAATLATYVAYMSAYFLRHTAETAAILGAFYCFDRHARGGPQRLLLAGSACASLSFLIRLPVAIIALPMAAFLLAGLQRRFGPLLSRGTWRRGELLGALGLLALPVAAGLAAHSLVNLYRWGSLLESPMMSQRAFFSTPLSVSGVANLVGPGSSVFLYSPLLVVLPLVWRVAWRRERALVLLGIGSFSVFWLFYSLYEYWTGLWSAPGPRYLTPTLPLLLLPLGVWLQRAGRAGRLFFLAAAAAGLLVQVALLTTSWAGIVTLMGYEAMGTPEFPFTFLFVPELSPVWVALRFFFTGQANGTWLAQLYRGWPGFEGAPAAAAGLVGAWALSLVLCGLRLRESLGLARAAVEAAPGDG